MRIFPLAHRQFPALMMLLGLLVLASGCVRNGLVQRDVSDSTATLTVVGDVRTVAMGRTNESRFWEVPSNALAIGLGTGSATQRVDLQGTALTVNDSALFEALDGSGLVRSDTALYTSYLIGLTPNQLPAATYTLRGGNDGHDVESIMLQLSRNHGPFFFVVGVGEFPLLSARALREAPMHEIAIHGPNVSRYFRDKSRTSGTPKALFAAAVHSDPNRLSGSDLRVFHEPAGTPRGDRRVIQAGYGLVSSTDGIDPARLASGGLAEAPGRILSVGELRPDSRLRNARIAVYEIRNLDRR